MRSSRLKAFVKHDSNGQLVPNVLVLRNKKPSGGNWLEINGNVCCPNVPPIAPTAPVVDDTANTFNWTFSAANTNLYDYEYTTNGGTSYTQVTAKPITGLTGARAIGTVGVRVRSIGGNPASSTIYNQTAYTV